MNSPETNATYDNVTATRPTGRMLISNFDRMSVTCQQNCPVLVPRPGRRPHTGGAPYLYPSWDGGRSTNHAPTFVPRPRERRKTHAPHFYPAQDGCRARTHQGRRRRPEARTRSERLTNNHTPGPRAARQTACRTPRAWKKQR